MTFGIGYWFMLVFKCQPRGLRLGLSASEQIMCIQSKSYVNMGLAASTLNATIDIIYAIIPMCLVWNTTMNLRTRCMVCFLLGVGSVVCVVTLIRIGYVRQLGRLRGDFLYDTYWLLSISMTECGLGISVISAATFKPLVQKWLGRESKSRQTGVMGRLATFRSINFQNGGQDSDRTKPHINSAGTGISTITGRESIGAMPDLFLAGERTLEDSKGESGVYVSTTVVIPSLSRTCLATMSTLGGSTTSKEPEEV